MAGEDEWTEQQEAYLVQEWLSGTSRAEICAGLLRNHNVTRSVAAVSVHANRMSLPSRYSLGKPVEMLPPPLPADHLDVQTKPTAKQRECLGCGRPFWSAHAGVRFCDSCRKRSEYEGNGMMGSVAASSRSRCRGAE